jgi:hypothetical protein
MKLFLSYLSISLILLSSCASYKYGGTETIKRNNTIVITSDNVNDFEVQTNFDKSLEKLSNGSTQLYVNRLKKGNLIVTLTNPIYDPVFLKLKRQVRPMAISKDIALGIFTFGIPIFIDVFNSDFYRIPKNSRVFNVHFEYKQSFMLDEFNKISKSKNPNDYQNWINKYPNSNIRQKVIDHKDSLELSIALSKESEAAVDDFISTHKQSNYLQDALNIKNEMVAAREMFESSKTVNTVSAYEAFLSKFPRSLHNSDAHRRLVSSAEKAALNSGKLNVMQDYIIKYLDVNLYFFNANELDEKISTISKAIDNQMVKDFIKKDPKNYYTDYSKLWQTYTKIKKEIPTGYLMNLDQTISYQSKICDLIFNKLKEATTSEKQIQLIEKSKLDFPELDLYDNSKNILITVLDNLNSSSGVLKLFNVGYLPYYFNSMSERNVLIGRNLYSYQSENYEALKNINYEEISISSGKLNGTSKCFQNSNLDFTLTMNNGNPRELSYYRYGKLVKTIFYPNSLNPYYYEFENGVNLTLNYANQKLSEIDKIEKNVKGYLNSKKYELMNPEIILLEPIGNEIISFLSENPIPEDKLRKPMLNKLNTIKSYAILANQKIQEKKDQEAKEFLALLMSYSANSNSSSGSRYSSGSSTYSSSSSTSSSRRDVPCPKCNQKFRFRIWKGAGGWGDFYDSNPGYVKCGMCDLGTKYLGGFYDDGSPKTESCPFAGRNSTRCENGWDKCSKCYGKGTIRE